MEIFSQCAFSLLSFVCLFLFCCCKGVVLHFNHGNCYLVLTIAMHLYVQSLEFAISDTGKSILPQHLLLVTDSLSATGEFVGLNASGIARQREHASVSSPFMQACLSVSSHI